MLEKNLKFNKYKEQQNKTIQDIIEAEAIEDGEPIERLAYLIEKGYGENDVWLNGLGVGSERLDQLITFDGAATTFQLGWSDMTPKNKAELISMGYIELTGSNINNITVTKSGNSYFQFTGFSDGDTLKIKKFSTLTTLRLDGNNINWTYSGALPTGLTSLRLYGNNINWTYSGALPTGLTTLRLDGNNINWTYSGALPAGLTSLYLYGTNINWTYSGALPAGLTSLYLYGTNINWTYSGALHTGLTSLLLNGNNINWTYSGALPTGLTTLRLYGNNINWTYYDVSGTGDISTLILSDFVTTAMNPAQLIQLLQSMAQRVGNLPATCTIGDYQNTDPTAQQIAEATADIDGTDAQKAKYWISQIFATKSTTKITLMSRSINKP